MEATGSKEQFCLLQIYGAPPGAPPEWANLGRNAMVFTGQVDLSELNSDILDILTQLKDKDAPFDWDLDITVGPKWAQLKQVAYLVAITDVYSSNTDEDNAFQAKVSVRGPTWSFPEGGTGQMVLHVKIEQAGEHLLIQQLSYNVTATGTLETPEDFIPSS